MRCLETVKERNASSKLVEGGFVGDYRTCRRNGHPQYNILPAHNRNTHPRKTDQFLDGTGFINSRF